MKHWKVLHNKPVTSSEEILSILLKNRDIKETETKEFLSPSLKKITSSSVGMDLKEIEQRISEIEEAIELCGDNDQDVLSNLENELENIIGLLEDMKC